MPNVIQRTRNTNDAATLSDAITLNTATSVKIADANTGRIFFCVNNNNEANGVWIKLQAASADDDQKGIFIGARSSWVMPVDNIYIGEISAIADMDSPDVFVTEY